MRRDQTQQGIQVHFSDNVAVALGDLASGVQVAVGKQSLCVVDQVPMGHKFALADISKGAAAVKYGSPFGEATTTIRQGQHVHSHNISTTLAGTESYPYKPTDGRDTCDASHTCLDRSFAGYRRSCGRVGTRNEIWILSTVGCVSRTTDRIARIAADRFSGRVDGIYSIIHPFGCSQLGDDLQDTQSILAGLINHPNAGGVLVVGLGCESNQIAALLARAADIDKDSGRIRYFNAQTVEDELETGLAAVAELVEYASRDSRSRCSLADLTVGLKCGGSDGFSGLSANPLVGRMCDAVTNAGGRAILTEIPEMFGAEQVLMNRCSNQTVHGQLVEVVNNFKQYFIDHGQPIYENPSPGNIEGGITTLEEKSLGATQKGGTAVVTDVLRYGERVVKAGLTILEAPGNDSVSSTAMVVAGATVLLFTTGRGTPLGCPVPTIKISSNSKIAAHKPHWIDFDAGTVLQGEAMENVDTRLLEKLVSVADGEPACNERNEEREIAIWKRGVTL